jgi:hypothetical protein
MSAYSVLPSPLPSQKINSGNCCVSCVEVGHDGVGCTEWMLQLRGCAKVVGIWKSTPLLKFRASVGVQKGESGPIPCICSGTLPRCSERLSARLSLHHPPDRPFWNSDNGVNMCRDVCAGHFQKSENGACAGVVRALQSRMW